MRPLDENDSTFVVPESNDILALYIDASHATCMNTRRSVGAWLATYGGTVIAYRAKYHVSVSTSSTEAEFIESVNGAKAAKHLRAGIIELGIPLPDATPLYIDNKATIMMGNANKQTPRARHIDIQYFAIQEWVKQKFVRLFHTPGIVNPADALTKALGYVLHHRHVTRAMGLCGSPFTSTYGRIPMHRRADD